ncbi:2-oxoglutarate dehydrogenase, E2 component, dihydrolipoamide succinyltransferase [Arthrobacter sp. H14]|uniref:2-oxoglutarate dehydrogenase, E2 component, dihydrolipoamide succinyltransferase n=1 Tax=Arthrobacter sp. H14 TaxID=1312959 RepID=UPI00047A1C79|nr:2-oxoglutarate dehydrogenase, E2 component, dihydrolipoamide succinyltransferase [Arthrobacter sp. H14]
MSESVNLPALGESVTEGTVTRWLKQVGDRVEVDEPLLEVSTDKVDTEIPSPVAGVIEEILVAEDETVEVGAPLVTIGDSEGGGSGDSDESAESAESDSSSEEHAEEEAEEVTKGEATEAAQIPEEAMSADESGSDGGKEASAGDEASSSDSGSGGGEGTDVTLPALGESVTEGTVTRWLKQVGDSVEVDEPLLEVSTDKVDTEIPSPVAGTLQEIKVAEDETVEVGAVLAVIGSGEAAPSSASADDAEPTAAAESSEREKPVEKPKEPAEESGGAEAPKDDKASDEKKTAEAKDDRTKEESAKSEESAPESQGKPSPDESGTDFNYVTPLVRKLANQNDIDLSTVKGTGVGGRIRKQDVIAAADAKKPEAASAESEAPAAAGKPSGGAVSEASSKLRGTVEKAPRIRQTIARRMRESLDVSAQLTQVIEVDMTKISKLRNAAKQSFQEQNGAKLTYLPFFAKAVAEALKQHPKLNASFDEEAKEIQYHAAEHLAIAVDTDRGLLVPVINDAGNLNLAGLAQKIADVGARTRDNTIGPNELSGGTFTITNIGSAGALFDTPIINQPQVGILGTGIIVKRPVVVTDADGDDTIAIRSMVYLSLTYDHRLVDGADAGRFLQSLKARLEEGAFEADLGL